MKKHVAMVAMAMGFVLLAGHNIYAASLDSVVKSQLGHLNTGPFDAQINQLIQQHPTVHIPSIGQIATDLIHHKNPFNLKALLLGMQNAVLGDLTTEGRVLGIILLLTVLGALLGRLSESFGDDKGGVIQISQMAVMSAVILVALHSFAVALAEVNGLVGGLVHLMESLIPLLIILMAGSGAIVSAGILHPLMIGTMNIVAVLIKSWVLPLILLATVVDLLGNWLPRFSLKNLGILLRQTGLILLSGLMTLFLGVMAVEGGAGSVADGVTLRTSKFLASTFVPVVGKIFSDAMEAVFGSSLLLKNALTMAGALGIIVMVAFPIIKLIIMMFLYRVGAAATQTLEVQGVTETLGTMSTALGWLIGITGGVALMFFLVITVVATASNGVGF